MQRPPIMIRKGNGAAKKSSRADDPSSSLSSETAEQHNSESQSEDSDPEQSELLALEQLLYRDASASPLLDKEEEQTLTRQAQEAWQNLINTFYENLTTLRAISSESEKVRKRDSLSERDIVTVLDRVATTVFEDVSTGPLLTLLKERLAGFRIRRDALVQRNMRLVISLARHYQGRGIDYLDLVQEGTFGLMRAIEKFDPAKDVRFGTYAIWWIWQSMSRAQQLGGAVIRTPTTVQAQQRRLRRLTSELEGAFLRAPTEDEIREAASETMGAQALSEAPLTVVSLDAPLKDGEEGRLEDVVAQTDMLSPEEEALKESQGKKLREVLTGLPPREEEILRLRFGFDGDRTHTLEEIGQRMGLTKERVRQLEWRARKRLKSLCQKGGLDITP